MSTFALSAAFWLPVFYVFVLSAALVLAPQRMAKPRLLGYGLLLAPFIPSYYFLPESGDDTIRAWATLAFVVGAFLCGACLFFAGKHVRLPKRGSYLVPTEEAEDLLSFAIAFVTAAIVLYVPGPRPILAALLSLIPLVIYKLAQEPVLSAVTARIPQP